MARRSEPVQRPVKRVEYELSFGSRDAEKGWRDLCATALASMADAWDYLTKTPETCTPPHGRLKGRYAYVTRNGRTHEQWQYELPNGARIWYWVQQPDGKMKSPGQVVLVRVATHHPNETK